MDIDEIWQGFLNIAKNEFSDTVYKAYLAGTSIKEIKKNKVTLQTPNIFVSNNLQKKYNDTIESILLKQKPLMQYENLELIYKIKKSVRPKDEINSITAKLVTEKINNQEKKETAFEGSKTPRGTGYGENLNPRYTFESFVVGDSNQIAFTVAQSVANDPGTRFNPLFVYGGVGLGKTHLIQAIGNDVIEKHPSAKVIYSTTDGYVNDFLDALRTKNKSLIDKYRNADVLIIDDIQFIAGKEKTQEEFFHTFNYLYQNNKQVIISADQPPQHIPTIQERLRSRFNMGMSIDVQPPDVETRLAILRAKSRYQGLDIGLDVLEFIAKNIQNNVRDLEGAINQIIVMCQMQGIRPDLEFVRGVLLAPKPMPRRFSAKDIIGAVSNFFAIDPSVIMSDRRDREASIARQMSMYLMRSELKMSLPQISKAVNRKDHTTAIHSIGKIEKLINDDYTIKRSLDKIKEALYV